MHKLKRLAGLWRGLLLSVGLSLLTPVFASSPVMLANVYHAGITLSDYWISEKYDGVRG